MLTAPSTSHPTTDHLLFTRPLSPPPPSRSLTRAFRFSTHNGISQNPAKPSDHWSAGALSTPTFSMGPNARSSMKGKEREAFDSLDPGSFAGSFAFDDSFPHLANRKASLGSPLSRPSTADPSSTPSVPRRQRGSILGAASDALRFGRRRKSVKALPPTPQPRLLISEVIEVRASAPTPPCDEDEEAEREQLRAAAVQSVGFNVGIDGSPVRERVTFSDEGDIDDDDGGDHNAHVNVNHHENGRASAAVSPTSPLPTDNGLSDATGSPQTVRQRAHARPSSTGKTVPFASTPPEVPTFPSTRAQIAPHEQLSATLPKHYPPPSLLMLALTKQWKARHVVLTAPIPAGASYLHVFKSSAADERELERLEINEHSVASVTDEDVGGRRGVVRVGGFDVGALRRELNGEENGITMMMLQITDANESQNWINAIKNAVLGQRSVRAGLGILTNSSGIPEPRGDLDVMMSMRMQGMLPSPTKPSFSVPDDANKARQSGSSSEDSSPPLSSRSRPASPRPPNGVLSLKNLFSVSGSGSTRPRSPSLARATSPDAASGESFGSAASSLLSMRTVADSPLIKPYSMLPPTGPTLDPTILQRKIIDTQSSLDWAPLDGPLRSSDVALSSSPPPRALSPSLNPPPPRRRAYTTNEPRLLPLLPSPDPGRFVYNHCNASTAGSFGVQVPDPHLERACSERGKPRAGSVSSTSTTTENGSARRWSRQSYVPPRLTPPSGSPQSASPPLSQPPPWQTTYHQVSEPERSPSRSSSQSQKTLPSIISGLHAASKRASASSSVYSVATTSSSPQHVGTFSISRAAGASHRVSIPPPPRPAPCTALPPTPTGSDTECPATIPIGAGKSVRRNSLARRALRLSLGQPVASLQAQLHTNDGFGTGSHSHSRSASVDGVPRSVLSHGYGIPPALLVPPTPPPTGPLPPPPVVPPTRSSTPVSTTANPRATSLKQRLRILSAPSGRATPTPPPILTALEIPTSMPATPIGERIAHIAPDADFLDDGETPVATVPPSRAALETAGTTAQWLEAHVISPTFSFPLPPLSLPHGPYEHVPPPASDRSPQEMTVLSPPPRRGSVRPLPSPSPEQERGPSAAWNERGNGNGAPPLMPRLDLACNASTLSLSIVNGAV